VNPFLTKDIPKLEIKQVEAIVLFMGRQMDELIIRNFSLASLEHFVRLHKDELLDILASKDLFCDVFCFALGRFLQEAIRSSLLPTVVPLVKQSLIIDLLLEVSEKKKEAEAAKRKQENDKSNGKRKSNIGLFQAVLGYSSVKYLKEFSEEELRDELYVDRAMRVSVVLVEEVQLPIAHEAVREFVHYTSHLLIFDQQDLMPIKFYEFSLELHQGLTKADAIYSQRIGQ
jgi:hypothetical protein